MRATPILAAIGFAALVSAGPCPFHHLVDAAASGQLNPREEAIVNKMARDPSYIPALDPEAAALMKRAAKSEPKAEAGPVKAEAVEKRQLPIIGGGLCMSSPHYGLPPSYADV